MKKIMLIMLLLGIFVLPIMGKEVKPKMVPVPGKNYVMLNVEVTQALYQEIMGTDPSYFSSSNLAEMYKDGYNIFNFSPDANFPVEQVSWLDAIRFCNKLSKKNGLKKAYIISEDNKVNWDKSADGFRLPTIEEWIYAAKGGENYKYAGSDDIDDVAWYRGTSEGTPHPVGQLDPNGYGLYDMCGNVWEWCWDVSPRVDTCHFYCGGGYFEKADKCNVSSEDSTSYNTKFRSIGFRVVRNIK